MTAEVAQSESETHQIETHLGICLSFPVENRNQLAWVLPTLSPCPTNTGRRAELGKAWGPVQLIVTLILTILEGMITPGRQYKPRNLSANARTCAGKVRNTALSSKDRTLLEAAGPEPSSLLAQVTGFGSHSEKMESRPARREDLRAGVGQSSRGSPRKSN